MKGAFFDIQREISQDHSLRSPLIKKIQSLRDGRFVISFFISFYASSPLSPQDADMIEEVLVNSETSNGITLILDAPGGDGLSAERIVQLCKKYSKKDFETIVPTRAKSAATMVCLGSDRILMSATSELGPIDPQLPIKIDETLEWVAADHVIRAYDALMDKAVHLKEGHIEPYLQQLSTFRAVQIEMLRDAKKLSESIAITSLKRGMLSNLTELEIKDRIKCFIEPSITLSHGRALNVEHLTECGLNIEVVDLNSKLWKAVRDLYTRSTWVVDRGKSGRKLLETVDSAFYAGG